MVEGAEFGILRESAGIAFTFAVGITPGWVGGVLEAPVNAVCPGVGFGSGCEVGEKGEG